MFTTVFLPCCTPFELTRRERLRRMRRPSSVVRPGQPRSLRNFPTTSRMGHGVLSPCPRFLTDAASTNSYNPELHNRTKHVARRHFFIRDMVEAFELNVPLVSTSNNYADFFTKPLKPSSFSAMRNKIMNIKPA